MTSFIIHSVERRLLLWTTYTANQLWFPWDMYFKVSAKCTLYVVNGAYIVARRKLIWKIILLHLTYDFILKRLFSLNYTLIISKVHVPTDNLIDKLINHIDSKVGYSFYLKCFERMNVLWYSSILLFLMQKKFVIFALLLSIFHVQSNIIHHRNIELSNKSFQNDV